MTRAIGLIGAAVLLAFVGGCVNLAPDYKRPEAPVPGFFPSVDGTSVDAAGPGALPAGDLGWREFFLDARLRRVVAKALAHNRDLRVAALNIEAARARYGIAGAALFPTVSASADASISRSSRGNFNDDNTVGDAIGRNNFDTGDDDGISDRESLELAFSSYELDFFGRLRNNKQAALDLLRSSAETRRSTRISLIAEVAVNWLQLAADRELLALARQTLKNQRENFDLVTQRHDYGVASGSDVANARSSVETARGDVAAFTAQVARDRNALRLVVGADVAAANLPAAHVPAGPVLNKLPAGVPATVLTRRPDVRAAEYTLKADNANIGAARAAFFPTVSLTASTGWATEGLSNLFSSDNFGWRFSPQILLPIFDAGANRARLDVAEIEKRVDIASYEKAIQTAFREVADALATRATIDERLDAQQALVAANRRAYQLSLARFRQGTDSYLDTLVAQRALNTAQQDEVDRRLAVQTNLVTLYKVLGGGALDEPEADTHRRPAPDNGS